MNRMLLLMAVVALLMATACRSRERRMAEMRTMSVIGEKEVGEWLIGLRYLPAAVAKGDTAEYCFTVDIKRKGPGLPIEADDPRFSFGTDSLFCIITGTDTLRPIFSTRVANGKLPGLQYMVIFGKASMRAGGGRSFLFKDWLLTNRNLLFALPMENIKKIDSLSLHI